MGLIFSRNPTSLAKGNTIHATTHLGDGEGVYLMTSGVGNNPMRFYKQSSSQNACGHSDSGKEAAATQRFNWAGEPLTIVARAENDAERPREIDVYVREGWERAGPSGGGIP